MNGERYIIYRAQREVWGTIRQVITAGGPPYRYSVNDINNQEIRYKFYAKDLKPGPPKDQLQLTVDKIISRRDDKVLVSFYGYPRQVHIMLD